MALCLLKLLEEPAELGFFSMRLTANRVKIMLHNALRPLLNDTFDQRDVPVGLLKRKSNQGSIKSD